MRHGQCGGQAKANPITYLESVDLNTRTLLQNYKGLHHFAEQFKNF